MSQREILVPGWSGGDKVEFSDFADSVDGGTELGAPHMGAWFEMNLSIPDTPLQALMEAAPGCEPERSMEEIQLIREAVVDCWTTLSTKDAFILNAYDSERLSYSKLGKRLGCSKSQAEREHKAAYARLAPLLRSQPVIQERYPALKPTTWEQAAADAVSYMRVVASTTLPVPFDEAINRGKHLLSLGWDAGTQLTDLLVSLGASAYSSLGVNDDDLYGSLVDLLVQRHHKYGPGNINEFKEYGLLVRMSDKVARIKNGSGDFEDDAFLDSYYDLVGYAAIAHMLANDTFNLPLENNS